MAIFVIYQAYIFLKKVLDLKMGFMLAF